MGRGSRDLTNAEYDKYLADRSFKSRSARQELEQRKAEKRGAHDSSGVGYHFGLGEGVVKVESKEHLKRVLDERGLMLKTDVNKDLKGPGSHEFGGRSK